MSVPMTAYYVDGNDVEDDDDSISGGAGGGMLRSALRNFIR
jgi:hypothetical protein